MPVQGFQMLATTLDDGEKRNVDDDVVAKLRRALSPADRAALPADAGCAPAWIADVCRRP